MNENAFLAAKNLKILYHNWCHIWLFDIVIVWYFSFVYFSGGVAVNLYLMLVNARCIENDFFERKNFLLKIVLNLEFFYSRFGSQFLMAYRNKYHIQKLWRQNSETFLQHVEKYNKNWEGQFQSIYDINNLHIT